MAKCPKCGIEVEENAKFCNACGAKLGVAETASDAANNIANNYKDKSFYELFTSKE